MKNYLITSCYQIREIYVPVKYFLENPFKQILNRTDSALKKAFLIGSDSKSSSSMWIDEEKFYKGATLEDFKTDIQEIVSVRKWSYIKSVQTRTKNSINIDSIKYDLNKTKKDIDDAFGLLLSCSSNQKSSLDNAVIEVYLESYESTLAELFSLYNTNYPGIFEAPDAKNESIINDEKKGIKKSLAGLVLDDASITPGRAKKLCKWLKEIEMIHKETKSQTVLNIFVRKKQMSNLTKVQWTGYNYELKYFILLLLKASIIKESGYQQRWKDTCSVFIDEDGNEYDNDDFSGNAHKINSDSKKKIESIITKLNFELNK